MANKVLPFVPTAVVAPPHWACGLVDGLPAHVWSPDCQKPGDRCACGAFTLPVWRPQMPNAAEAEAEATAS